MIDMPNRKGAAVTGIIVALIIPILFAILFLTLYGWKSWAINRHAHQEYRRQVEERAALKAMEPQRPSRTWNSPDGKYAFLYYKDDVHSTRKRVQLLETKTGAILWKYETDAELDCAWREDGKAMAAEERVTGKSRNTTVVLLDDGNIRKIQMGPAIEKLLLDQRKRRPLTDSVELYGWKGDNLQVNWLGNRFTRREVDREVVSTTGWYQLLLAINDDGTLSVVKARGILGAHGITF